MRHSTVDYCRLLVIRAKMIFFALNITLCHLHGWKDNVRTTIRVDWYHAELRQLIYSSWLDLSRSRNARLVLLYSYIDKSLSTIVLLKKILFYLIYSQYWYLPAFIRKFLPKQLKMKNGNFSVGPFFVRDATKSLLLCVIIINM